MTPSKKLVPIVLAVALGLAACGSSSGSDGSTATTSSASTSSASTDGTTSSATKVSANDASKDEIAAALAAAGVDNPDRWADEIVEYRPYDDAAQGFPSLRAELAKYNPADGTVDQIVAVLSQ